MGFSSRSSTRHLHTGLCQQLVSVHEFKDLGACFSSSLLGLSFLRSDSPQREAFPPCQWLTREKQGPPRAPGAPTRCPLPQGLPARGGWYPACWRPSVLAHLPPASSLLPGIGPLDWSPSGAFAAGSLNWTSVTSVTGGLHSCLGMLGPELSLHWGTLAGCSSLSHTEEVWPIGSCLLSRCRPSRRWGPAWRVLGTQRSGE